MKLHYRLFACLFFIFFIGCKDTKDKNVLVDEQTHDSIENLLIITLDEINHNLEMIREKQGLIVSGNNSEDINKKSEILRNISLINALLEENKKKISELTKQSRQLGSDKSALARIAVQTKSRIEKQENEITSLKMQLALEEYKVADLYNQMDEMLVANEILLSEKNALIEANAQFDKDLNKAFFVYGTYDELRDKNIIEKKGILTIGQQNTLANAFFKNRSYFSEVDVREIKQIPILGKKPKLLTFHPDDSYEIVDANGEYSGINILDAQAFWSVSRFLVVQVK